MLRTISKYLQQSLVAGGSQEKVTISILSINSIICVISNEINTT